VERPVRRVGERARTVVVRARHLGETGAKYSLMGRRRGAG
jgi:hypothetical protein